MSEKAQWYRLTLGILPPEGVVIDSLTEAKICRAIGEVVGNWTMIYGVKLELIPVAEREYPMVSKPGPFELARHAPECPVNVGKKCCCVGARA